MASGAPWQSTKRIRMRISLADGVDVPTSMGKHSRLASSIIFNVRNRRPQYKASCMKSSAQQRFGSLATSSGWHGRSGNRFLQRRGKFKPISQYTRCTRFLLQQRPSSHSRVKHFQNHQRPRRLTMALSASIASASRSDADTGLL